MQSDASEQAARWNGKAGCAWVEAQAFLDQMFKPLEDRLVAAVHAARIKRVLDVGCGTGSTTVALAQAVGADGQVVGVDISEPMIAAANARAARGGSRATFIQADAGTHPFVPASIEMIVSRFGVMFFADPVAAFANLRRAATNDARLLCLVWRGMDDNPFMTTAERVAAPVLPLPPRDPDKPGQFAFGDRDRVHGILAASGWHRIDIQSLDVVCTFPASALESYLTRLGPVGLALAEVDDATRAAVLAIVRPAFESYVHGDEVRFTAACWEMRAQAV